jgi:hypothetical protein
MQTEVEKKLVPAGNADHSRGVVIERPQISERLFVKKITASGAGFVNLSPPKK